MTFLPDSLAALRDARFDTVIDVRAPREFAEDHVPGAINLPVLDDVERARVGTIYTKQSPFAARKIGAALVARNAARHIEDALMDHDGGWQPLVYCWRGGQRSNSFASILSQIGWRVSVLEGGYRSYRHLVKTQLYDLPLSAPLVLLDGYTGTAKTDLLLRVAARGGQIIDLEGLANHRGSVFGAMGEQPAQKLFESKLARALLALDPDRPVLIEAESSKVGQRIVPPSIWAAMRSAPRLRIKAPLAARAAYLQLTYDDIVDDPERLDAVLSSLIPIQGHKRIEAWRDLARTGDRITLASELMVHHYDPRYARHAEDADITIHSDRLDDGALERLADRIVGGMGRLAGRVRPG